MVRIFGIALALILIFVSQAKADGVVVNTNGTISWDPNSETDLLTYRVYIGSTPGVYDVVVSVGLTNTPQSPSVIIKDVFPTITEGQKYTAVDVCDLAANCGGKSPDVPFVLDITAPANVKGVVIKKVPDIP